MVHRRGAPAGHQLLLVHPAAGERGRADVPQDGVHQLPEPKQRRAGRPDPWRCAGGASGDAGFRQFPVRGGQLAAAGHRRLSQARRGRAAPYLYRPESGAAAPGVRGAGGGRVLPAGEGSAADPGGHLRACAAGRNVADAAAGEGGHPGHRRLAGGGVAVAGGGRRGGRDGRAALSPVLGAERGAAAGGSAAAESL